MSKVSAAKDQIATLPARAASALHELAVVAGISAATLVAAAPSEGSGAASSAGGATASDTPASSAKKISPYLALDRAGPWIARGVARGRARLDRANVALESLREALSVPLPPRATSAETQARAERVNRRALEAQEASTALARLPEQTTQLTAAMDDLNGRIPEIAVSAELWADHALADFGADAAYLARAEKQKRSVTRMQVEALVAIQLARHETSTWPSKIAELQTSSGTLLAQVTSLPATEAKATEPLIAAFPQVEDPPRRAEDPQPPQTAPIFVEPTPVQRDDASRTDVPLIIAATLTTASLIAAIYTVDRVAATNSCFNASDGYGCSNADSLKSQMDTGRAMTIVFGTGAVGALIWALVD